jgi:hypothetical protein
MTPEIKKALDLAHGYLDRLIRGLNMDDTSEAVQVRDAIKQALAAPTVQEADTYGYAKRLAEAIWEMHYKTIAVNWKPLPDLIGVLTQIDNMTSGLIAPVAQPTPTKWGIQ